MYIVHSSKQHYRKNLKNVEVIKRIKSFHRIFFLEIEIIRKLQNKNQSKSIQRLSNNRKKKFTGYQSAHAFNPTITEHIKKKISQPFQKIVILAYKDDIEIKKNFPLIDLPINCVIKDNKNSKPGANSHSNQEMRDLI